jgi:regulator of replication initiation timing
MLNGRTILHGILCVLFIAAAFGQEPSDPNIITVTEKIDLRELNTTVGELNKTVGELSKTVGELKTTVTKLEERTGIMLNLQYIILAGIFGPLLYSIYQSNKNNARGEATSVNNSEASSTNLPQVPEDEVAPSPTLPLRFPNGENIKDRLKSDSLATKESA